MTEPVTIERLERALAVCAYILVLDGPVVVPLFERLERDLAALRAQHGAMDRAKDLPCELGRFGRPLSRPTFSILNRSG
jgi:hypothetical protein